MYKEKHKTARRTKVTRLCWWRFTASCEEKDAKIKTSLKERSNPGHSRESMV
jgi:hypothetical protein